MDHSEISCLRQVDSEGDIYDVLTQGYSFPSGHSTIAASTYGSLPAYQRKKKWLAVVSYAIILLVGVSRFCLGVHYPTDVLVGWALGFLAIWFVPLLMRKVKNKYIAYLVLFAIALPGFFYCDSTDYYTAFGMLIGSCLGFEWEERRVHFENTRNVLFCLLRIAGGAGIYFGLDFVLKLPFSPEFLVTNSFLPHLIRTLRYAVIMFVDLGLYPLLFKPVEQTLRRLFGNQANKA